MDEKSVDPDQLASPETSYPGSVHCFQEDEEF